MAQTMNDTTVISIPKIAPNTDTFPVALTVLGAFGVLWAIRSGMKGVGQLQLTGSAIRGIETMAYVTIGGAAIRTFQTHYPDNMVAKAYNFIY